MTTPQWDSPRDVAWLAHFLHVTKLPFNGCPPCAKLCLQLNLLFPSLVSNNILRMIRYPQVQTMKLRVRETKAAVRDFIISKDPGSGPGLSVCAPGIAEAPQAWSSTCEWNSLPGPAAAGQPPEARSSGCLFQPTPEPSTATPTQGTSFTSVPTGFTSVFNKEQVGGSSWFFTHPPQSEKSQAVHPPGKPGHMPADLQRPSSWDGHY